MALPENNITTAIVKAELGATTNKVKELCNQPNINIFSEKKPIVNPKGTPQDAEWYKATDGMFGFSVSPYVLGQASALDGWLYVPPTNNARLGHFRGYEHNAGMHFKMPDPVITVNQYNSNIVTVSPYYDPGGSTGGLWAPDMVYQGIPITNMYFGVYIDRGGGLFYSYTEQSTFGNGGGITINTSGWTRTSYDMICFLTDEPFTSVNNPSPTYQHMIEFSDLDGYNPVTLDVTYSAPPSPLSVVSAYGDDAPYQSGWANDYYSNFPYSEPISVRYQDGTVYFGWRLRNNSASTIQLYETYFQVTVGASLNAEPIYSNNVRTVHYSQFVIPYDEEMYAPPEWGTNDLILGSGQEAYVWTKMPNVANVNSDGSNGTLTNGQTGPINITLQYDDGNGNTFSRGLFYNAIARDLPSNIFAAGTS